MRTTLPHDVLLLLNRWYDLNERKPSKIEQKKLADLTDLTSKQIDKWFSNKKARTTSKQTPSKNLSFETKKALVEYFDFNDYPGPQELNKLSIRLNLEEKKVYDWFVKRRYQQKKKLLS